MKKFGLITAAFLLILASCQKAPELNQEIIDHEGEKILVGKIDLLGMSVEPYSLWFDENYKNYIVDEASLQGVDLGDIDIKLFLGTWCPDSQLQVPQFYKILTSQGYDMTRMEMISVDHHPDRDLKSPQGEEVGLNIEFVPTFIFYRNGVEIGRIVEFPKASLEMDMAGIVGLN